MIAILIAQLLITACGAGIIWALAGQAPAQLFGIGGAIMLANLTVHVVVWPRILVKKQVAMSIGVIVIKFLILGWIIYDVTTETCAGDLHKLAWFAAGLTTVVASSFAAAILALLKSSRRLKTQSN